MKIRPIEANLPWEPLPVAKPVYKSRFKRLFERQFSSVSRVPTPDKPTGACCCCKDGLEESEPSSVCLARMVQNFIEESNEKPQPRCERKRCNCFNGNCTDNSDEEPEACNSSSADVCDLLKSLAPCLCVSERNLLADTAKIVEKNKISKRKDGLCRKIVTDGLTALGYGASICKSKWEKSPSFPAGEYEYVDVVVEGQRFIVDMEFRSEFEVARPSKAYRAVLQTLPAIFVGQADRLEKIIGIVSEAARQSLKKKGMPLPPWRKAEYVKAKWLSPFTRISPTPKSLSSTSCTTPISLKTTSNRRPESGLVIAEKSSCHGELKLLFGKQVLPVEKVDNGEEGVVVFSDHSDSSCEEVGIKGVTPLVEEQWRPPEIGPKSLHRGVKFVTGLASLIED